MKVYFNNLKKVFLLYYGYTKYRIFVLVILSALSGLLEGFGVSMLFPLLESFSKQNIGKSTFNVESFERFFELIHLEPSTFVLVLIFLSSFILKSLFKYFVGVYKTKLSTKMLSSIRLDFLRRFLNLDYRVYMTMDAGRLSNTFTLELEKTMSGFIYFCNYFVGLFTGLAFLVLVCFISFPFTVLIILVGTFYFLLFSKINQSINLFSKNIASQNSIFNSLLIQLIQSFKYIKSTNSKDGIKKKLERNINEIRELKYKMDIRQSFVSAIQEPLVIFLLIFVVYLNVVFFDTEISAIITILLLFYRSLNYFLSSQLIWNNFISQVGSTESVMDLKSYLDDSQEIKSGKCNPIFECEIKLEDVSYGYSPQNLILKNVNIVLPKNKTIAIVGKSGSGKSTLVNLITGLLKVKDGQILIDGVDIKNINVDQWRKRIGYITQESVLFNDSVRNNITMWETHGAFKIGEFEKALQLANVKEFYDEELDSIKTLGDRGISLSGGQRQRIAIARELYKSPELLILDEATSSLDSETENYISESIKMLQGSLAIVIIAHRLSTIKNCDWIYVLDGGEIIEEGSYDELSNNSNSQLSYFIKMQSLV